MRWVDAREKNLSKYAAKVLVVHKVLNSMHARMVADLFDMYNASHDSFDCGACAEWGWNATAALGAAARHLRPPQHVRCCAKVDSGARPREAWRRRKPGRASVPRRVQTTPGGDYGRKRYHT